MSTPNAWFEDMSKMASGAAGALMDMRRELEQMVAEQCKQLLGRADLITREEFEVVKLMAEKARAENDALRERLDMLEKTTKAAPAKKKPSSK